MQAVADRNVDQPPFAADGDGGFRAELGQGKQARPAPASKNNREDVLHLAILSGVGNPAAWGVWDGPVKRLASRYLNVT